MEPHDLPVYQQKDRILEALKDHQVIVVESPTGSGKTTQLPIILHEAGYSKYGVIGVTQPRRIAAISVSDFQARQLGTRVPGLVGYKMRFEDRTNSETRIKIMTDGILLQEMKLDPALSKYSVLMVDEAHERSLNIDFILGLVKRVVEARPEFKVIVSSATINAEVFSEYFGECPVVKIETPMYPVTVVYDPPATTVDGEEVSRQTQDDLLQEKISGIVARIVQERREGDILIFLPGEKAIKDCMQRLAFGPVGRSLHLVPLYARLGKDEQERVFDKAPLLPGLGGRKTKVVIATNIAETSVTIDGITSVIDSGLSKLNFYNPRTFTSSLIESPVSKASANQRKGRAGRTRPGSCYRLYSRDDFESRPLFTTEEIYRTDLTEVVLRMAELGITEFERFEFISQPPKSGIRGAEEALALLDALTPERTLTKVGQMMCAFPLLPRHSRIIVEAVLSWPGVVEEAIIAASFLSTTSPYVLPPGEEMEARKAHHAFRDAAGDFVSYLRIYEAFMAAKDKTKFCDRSYLDERTMLEIARIKEQLELIVSGLGVPIAKGGPIADYLCAVSRGLIQFVCVRQERGLFRSLTAEKIQIHPGSVMYRENPPFIVAGEVVRTTRMYAMSVSPLRREWLPLVSPRLESLLAGGVRPSEYAERAGAAGRDYISAGKERARAEREERSERARAGSRRAEAARGRGAAQEGRGGPHQWSSPEEELARVPDSSGGRTTASARAEALAGGPPERPQRDFTNKVKIGSEVFDLSGEKKKKVANLDWKRLKKVREEIDRDSLGRFAGLRGVITAGREKLLDGEKLEVILKIAALIDLDRDLARTWPRCKNYETPAELHELVAALDHVLQVSRAKDKTKELGFVALFTDGEGSFWFRVSRGFHTALNESVASLDALADLVAAPPAADTADAPAAAPASPITQAERDAVNSLYRKLASFFE